MHSLWAWIWKEEYLHLRVVADRSWNFREYNHVEEGLLITTPPLPETNGEQMDRVFFNLLIQLNFWQSQASQMRRRKIDDAMARICEAARKAKRRS